MSYILTPTTNLPKIRTKIEGENAMIIAPKVNSISAIIITGFLPILSLIGPDNNDPIAAPSKAIDTIV